VNPAMVGGSLVSRYYAAWNARDAASLASLFVDAGTYEDPTTAGTVATSDLVRVLNGLAEACPDFRFEARDSVNTEQRCAVEWTLTREKRGPLLGGAAPMNARALLSGVDVFDLVPGGIGCVRRYFDQKGFAERLGLMALIQPIEQGPAKFGYAMRVPSGNPRPPGVVALTYIEAADEDEKERIRAHARQNVQDFLKEPGFISIVTGFCGLRGFTVTAWEDEAALRRALSGHHAVAMHELFSQNFVASVWTSVWKPTRINRIWLRCKGCGALQDVSDDHRECTRCRAKLPERPSFW
jgi:steroid delta-isomerase-like uncharacterized protein